MHFCAFIVQVVELHSVQCTSKVFLSKSNLVCTNAHASTRDISITLNSTTKHYTGDEINWKQNAYTRQAKRV